MTRPRGSARDLAAPAMGAPQKAPKRPPALKRAPRKRKTASDTLPALSAAVSGLSEAAFQRLVVAGLEHRGWIVWHVPDSRRMKRGLPDLICVHPMKPGRMLAYEIKRDRGRVKPEQAIAIVCLGTVPGVDARIVRPEDWAEIVKELDRR